MPSQLESARENGVPTYLFVNENIGGHRTVHSALKRVFETRDDVIVEFVHGRDPGILGKILRAPIPLLARLDLDLQPLRAQLVHSFLVRRRVAKRLEQRRFDGIHVYTQNTFLGGARLLRRYPAIITTDSTGILNAMSIPYRTPTRFTAAMSRVGLLWEKPVLAAAQRVFANSYKVRDSLLSPDYGLAEDKVERLEMGIWSPYLGRVPDKRANTGQRPTIVFSGVSLERKGGLLLLDLWRKDLNSVADLLLITKDHVEPEPGLRVVNDLLPGDERLWTLLSESDIMCFPSLIDQAPNAVLEASSAGLPVVSNPIGAIPEMVIDGETGLLVDCEDPDEVLAALRTLIADPELRQRLGHAGSRHVAKNYSITQSAERIIDAMNSVVAESHLKEVRNER